MTAVQRQSVDELAAGRDRALDAARAVAMLAVAVGHWLVTEPLATADGLQIRDVLSELPGAAHVTWVFQVIPLFMVAGFAAGVPSWRRHRDRGGNAGGWVARRCWRLLWPTLPVVAFWTLLTQVGDHVLGLDDSLLAATRGIGLVLWFLAIYVVLIALLPTLDGLAERFGTLQVILAFAVPALIVDVVAARLGYVSSIEPSWVWINYLLWWAPVGLAGRWWPQTLQPRGRRIGGIVALSSLVLLITLTAVGWYPVAMVGVTGQARSNSLPPTFALALLAAVQVGALFAVSERLRQRLTNPRWYIPVAVAGSRAMTIYLWHLLGPVVVTLTLVLPGVWPAPPLGSLQWWAVRFAWVVVNAVLITPVVVLLGRFEQPPARLAVTAASWRSTAAVLLCVLGWAAVAISGLHVPAWPLAFPWLHVAALAAAGILLVSSGRRSPSAVQPPSAASP